MGRLGICHQNIKFPLNHKPSLLPIISKLNYPWLIKKMFLRDCKGQRLQLSLKFSLLKHLSEVLLREFKL